jgi:hypothetical protein
VANTSVKVMRFRGHPIRCNVPDAHGCGRATCKGSEERENDGGTHGNMHAKGCKTKPEWCVQEHGMSRLRPCLIQLIDYIIWNVVEII